MSDVSYRLLVNVMMALGALIALARGSAAERNASGVIILNVLVGTFFYPLFPGNEGLIRLLNDGLAAVALLTITLFYGALWMGGVMMFFAAQFALHSYYIVVERSQTDYLHALVNNVNWTGISLCLIIGTVIAWRRRLRAQPHADVVTSA